jgi:hypothetical protein
MYEGLFDRGERADGLRKALVDREKRAHGLAQLILDASRHCQNVVLIIVVKDEAAGCRNGGTDSVRHCRRRVCGMEQLGCLVVC